MFNDITVNHGYQEWLKTAAILDPPYDYISFSDFDEQNVKRKSNKDTAFSRTYSEYWKVRDERAHQSNIRKRTQAALQDITDNIVGSMVDSTKRLRSNNPETANDATDDNISSVVKVYEKESAPSPTSIRSIIKSYQLPNNEVFDMIVHADVNFIEAVGLYCLNLIQSPRNPLLFSSLERTAATQTTIMLLHNLFLSVNDLIGFNWIEVETLLTNKTKWDGVGFCPTSEKKIGLVLVEFSGGIMFNSTKKKATHDESKIENGIISFIEFTKSKAAYFVRFHAMKLYLEAIFYVDETYIRRTYITMKFPTTATELQVFFTQVPMVLNWKKSLVDSLSQIEY
ncbi:hypothetical protein INT48_005768 [Thamnidium elegans]|uniref:Uncharacterized protein n=1 Tax=Thamnidium elegans TaxID=101142 RepID=A0A8H7W0G9_9FUNG|nr:hypothetical protein INT48_005768 [Thamnidium elegans]